MYPYSSTQVNLPPRLGQRIINWTQQNVPAKKLTDDGIETEPHITVKYGINGDDPAPLMHVLSQVKPLRVTLGQVALFRTREDYDVLTLRIESPSLHRANALIRETVECHDSFPDYKPHLTLAYVKKGSCDHLVGKTPFRGITLTFDRIKFSGRNGKLQTILLGSNAQMHDREKPMDSRQMKFNRPLHLILH